MTSLWDGPQRVIHVINQICIFDYGSSMIGINISWNFFAISLVISPKLSHNRNICSKTETLLPIKQISWLGFSYWVIWFITHVPLKYIHNWLKTIYLETGLQEFALYKRILIADRYHSRQMDLSYELLLWWFLAILFTVKNHMYIQSSYYYMAYTIDLCTCIIPFSFVYPVPTFLKNM